jgi:hypothetical protein
VNSDFRFFSFRSVCRVLARSAQPAVAFLLATVPATRGLYRFYGAGFSFTAESAPYIFAHPAGATVTQGESVPLSTNIFGNPSPGFQWRKNGVAFRGATSDTLTISSVRFAAPRRNVAAIAIEDPAPYRDFFAALSKSLFLEAQAVG